MLCVCVCAFLVQRFGDCVAEWLYPERYDRDTTGLNRYMRACSQFEVKPVRYFIQHMQDEQLCLKHHGLGPTAMKALSIPLEVSEHRPLTILSGLNIANEALTFCLTLKHFGRYLHSRLRSCPVLRYKNKTNCQGCVQMS